MILPSPRAPRPVVQDLAAREDLSVPRRRVLGVLENADEPMRALDVAEALHLHHNTVREHLDALVAAGLVTSAPVGTGRRGRPSLYFTATLARPPEILDHALTLLDAVIENVGTAAEQVQKAADIGRSWARTTPPTTAENDVLPSAPVRRRLNALVPGLLQRGFSPVVADDGVLIRSCPFLSAQRGPNPLVCSMHEAFLCEVFERVGGGRVGGGRVGEPDGAAGTPNDSPAAPVGSATDVPGRLPIRTATSAATDSSTNEADVVSIRSGSTRAMGPSSPRSARTPATERLRILPLLPDGCHVVVTA